LLGYFHIKILLLSVTPRDANAYHFLTKFSGGNIAFAETTSPATASGSDAETPRVLFTFVALAAFA
jgi:hypothetical protein